MRSFAPTAETIVPRMRCSGLPAIPAIHAEPGRLERITVCTRPFRASGPRIEPEQVGDKLIVHNYGHGGSGWSLSWGSADLYPPSIDSGPGEHAFPTRFCRQERTLRFHITELSEQLLATFRARGGTLHRTEFHTVAELADLPEPVIVNCTGYGARALFGDKTLTPVHGQIGWLPPQPEVRYSLQWEQLSVVGRRDGIVMQMGAASDGMGWGDATEMPDRAEAEEVLRLLAELQAFRVPAP